MNLIRDDSSNQHKHLFQPQQQQAQAQPSSGVPILAVALLSIMGTFLLLASYYMFVVKCCSTRCHHLLNPLRSFSIFPSQQQHDDDEDGDEEDSFIALSPATTRPLGLGEAEIRDIPSFRFKGGELGVLGCVVCLSEFQVRDTVRVLPSCSHAFHLDCIDIWLQSNANCPLCRTGIALLPGGVEAVRPPLAPSSSPQAYPDGSLVGSDEDFVVIELGESDDREMIVRENDQRERVSGREVLESSKEMESGEKVMVNKFHHVSIMGDEGIVDVRDDDDDGFCVQPMRRSFSLDSAVSEIMFRKGEIRTSTEEECEGRARRTIFAFRHGRGSRNAVVPFEM